MIKFEIGKEYGVRAFSNYEFIIKERIKHQWQLPGLSVSSGLGQCDFHSNYRIGFVKKT